eukprot:2159957-Amphidinium_carterae.1
MLRSRPLLKPPWSDRRHLSILFGNLIQCVDCLNSSFRCAACALDLSHVPSYRYLLEAFLRMSLLRMSDSLRARQHKNNKRLGGVKRRLNKWRLSYCSSTRPFNQEYFAAPLGTACGPESRF